MCCDSLVDKLPNVNSCQTRFMDYCSPSVLNSMICNGVDQYKLLSLISILNSSKSPGPDNIGPKLIKEVAYCIQSINKFISRHSTEARATMRLCRIKEKCLKTDLKCVNGWSSSTVPYYHNHCCMLSTCFILMCFLTV